MPITSPDDRGKMPLPLKTQFLRSKKMDGFTKRPEFKARESR
jgi:hypothetical protein